jgi:hypothetical protein
MDAFVLEKSDGCRMCGWGRLWELICGGVTCICCDAWMVGGRVQVFFLPALYLSGDVQVDGKDVVDYAWVTKDELKDYLSPDLYAKARLFLL